jgi:2-keto-4-pentenoate hydratase/2-oxohepta-3-ene-1,7-dioic acid hydratase in catechol pathway
MKILYHWQDNELWPAIATEEGVIDVRKHIGENGSPITGDQPLLIEDLEVFKNIKEKVSGNRELLVPEASLVIGPCVPKPPKIICIGLNYRKHALESGMEIPAVPVVFTKYNNTLTDFGSDVTLGKVGEQFDYEVELGIVIGKKCKNVSAKEALNYVLGYCVANDLSCRDLQFKTSQWLLGKSLDQFLPLGKYLVTADEVGDPQNLKLLCSLNGELRQNSNTADMVFPVSEIIAYLSKHMTLEPGDLILSGTPEGVIMGLPEKNWLKPGDKVKVEIEKLGYTENVMA